nr:TcpQ domain-containing protein [Pantoea cypripedii]
MAVPSRRTVTSASLLSCSVMLAGCTSSSSNTTPYASGHYLQPARFDDVYRNRSPEVVRYDRYTLVSTRPADAQLDPLNQIVDITMPAQLVSTVGEGFRYLLLESGYSLCSATSSAFSELLSRPLPAVQREIGPLKLSEALQVVAGPAWRLKVDEVNREICFELRDQYRSFSVPASVNTQLAPRVVSAPLMSNRPVQVSAPAMKENSPPQNPFTGETLNTAATAKKSALVPQSLAVPSPVLTTEKAAIPGKPSGKTSPDLKRSSVSTPSTGLLLKKSTPATVKSPSVQPTTVNLSHQAPAQSSVRPVTTLPPAPPASSLYPTGTLVTASPVGQTWRAEPGSTLKETLTNWASKASCSNGGNWVVIWPVSLDYRIDAPLVFHGNFESVLVQVFDLYRKAEKPLFAEANRIQCLVSVSDTPAGGGQ